MSGKILLVEDDTSIATVIVAALEDEQISVHRCSSISERDRLLKQHSFDAMLTDVILDDGDGIASLDTAREVDAQMPVIVLSAQNTLDTAVRASETRAFEYFPKPFDLDELVQATKQAIGKRREERGDTPELDDGGLPCGGAAQQGHAGRISHDCPRVA